MLGDGNLRLHVAVQLQGVIAAHVGAWREAIERFEVVHRSRLPSELFGLRGFGDQSEPVPY